MQQNMDLPSELLLTIAEYEPNVHLQLDPHEILRRISVVNPSLNIEHYLLELLEFANKQAKIGNNVAHDLYVYFKDVGVASYTICPSITYNPDHFSVCVHHPHDIDDNVLSKIFGVDIMPRAVVGFGLGPDTTPTIQVFDIPVQGYSSIMEDTANVAKIYKTKCETSGLFGTSIIF